MARPRQVLQHHRAVVGRREVRVLHRLFVRAADRGEQEALRRLTAPQPRAVGDVDHLLRLVDDHDRVGGGDHDVDGLVGLERLDAVHEDLRTDEWPHGVVEKNLSFALPECGERQLRALVPIAAAGDNRLDLRITITDGVFEPVDPFRRHHDDDGINDRGSGNDIEGVLDDRLSGHLEHLLGNSQADPGPGASRQNDRCRRKSATRHSMPFLGCGTSADGVKIVRVAGRRRMPNAVARAPFTRSEQGRDLPFCASPVVLGPLHPSREGRSDQQPLADLAWLHGGRARRVRAHQTASEADDATASAKAPAYGGEH